VNNMAPSTATDTSEPIYFFSLRNRPHGMFSQHYKCIFTDPKDPDPKFNCAEQYMMYHKAKTFNDTDNASKIRIATKPSAQKTLGGTVRGFNDAVWDSVKIGIVERGNYLKFSQNEDLKKVLLETGDRLLVEAAKLDRIWGIGYTAGTAKTVSRDTWGQNLLGIALMNVRKRIREEDAEAQKGKKSDESDPDTTEDESDEEPERLPTPTTKKRKHDIITIEDSDDESIKEETVSSKKPRVASTTGKNQELRHLFNATKGKHN
jgi:ribA/ribD-fused uncharacterized protein